jgi:hypothetical protein
MRADRSGWFVLRVWESAILANLDRVASRVESALPPSVFDLLTLSMNLDVQTDLCLISPHEVSSVKTADAQHYLYAYAAV